MLVLDYLLFYVYKLNLRFKNLEFLFFFRLFATENLDFPSKNYEVVLSDVRPFRWVYEKRLKNVETRRKGTRSAAQLLICAVCNVFFFFQNPSSIHFFFQIPYGKGVVAKEGCKKFRSKMFFT